MSTTHLGATDSRTPMTFARAQSISRILAALLGIGFWVTAVIGVFAFVVFLGSSIWSPISEPGTLRWIYPAKVLLSSLSVVNWLGVSATVLLHLGPDAVALRLGRRIFGRFARGEVFTAVAYADIRAASLWMIVASLTSSIAQMLFNVSVGVGLEDVPFCNPSLLFFGLCSYVAAYVMAEAGRIADDNASIV